jgi:hypothetical protein
VIVLAALVVFGTVFVFWKGGELAPIARQLVMIFAALFATVLLFFGSSAATLTGALGGTRFRVTGASAVGLVFYLVLYKFAPAPEYRGVSIYLEHGGQPLVKDFGVTMRVAGIDPITKRGENGVAIVQVLSHHEHVNGISVDCAGYRLDDREVGPFKIQDGIIRLRMVKTETPPFAPDQLPSEHSIAGLPPREAVEALPRFKPTDVTFKYKNLTDANLLLLVFNCSRHYNPPSGELAPKSAWAIWDFPAQDEFQVFDRFQGGTGWFCFFVVGHKQAGSGSRVFPLGCKNIFESKVPTLVVTETKDRDRLYKGTFGAEE